MALSLLLLVVGSLVAASMPGAVVDGTDRHILFHGHIVDTAIEPGLAPLTSARQLQETVSETEAGEDGEPTTWLVHVVPKLTHQAILQLQVAVGVEFTGYLPRNTYILVAPKALARRAVSLPFVLWVGPLKARSKMAGLLSEYAHVAEALLPPSSSVPATTAADDSQSHVSGSTPAVSSKGDLANLSDASTAGLWNSSDLSSLAQLTRRLGELEAKGLHIPNHLPAVLEGSRLVVQLPPLRSRRDRAEAIAVAQKWTDEVAQMPGSYLSQLQIRAGSPQNIYVSFPPSFPLAALCTTAMWFARKPEVFAVEKAVDMKVTNFYAQGLTQARGDDEGEPVRLGMWERGLRGQNQVVAVADTGVDHDHCFFRDVLAGDQFGVRHRKIIGYESTVQGDGRDRRGGHGTHVAGTIAGNALPGSPPELAKHNGIAPDAKLFIQDAADVTGRMLVPDDLKGDLFTRAYLQNAFIHSNSWGCAGGPAACNKYTSQAQMVDEMMWEHPDLLILFAAGNDGTIAEDTQIGAPATAKNSLTVGASMTTNQGFRDASKYIDWGDRVRVMRETLGVGPDYDCCRDQSQVNKRFCCQKTYEAYIRSDVDKNYQENLAQFSSRGPTFDLRNKPEVVAPGNVVVSAYSDGNLGTNQCGTESPEGSTQGGGGLIAMQGTSMATPVVAGAVALIRQYFTEGRYAGVSGSLAGTPLIPSAALLKAVLANGARPLTGYFDAKTNGLDWWKLGNVYPIDTFQGFGGVRLRTVLRFADSSHMLWVKDNTTIGTGEHHSVCIKMERAGTVKVTLAWTEPPGTLLGMPFINNLDLYVGKGADDVAAGNFVDKRDVRNNMEQVIYPPPDQSDGLDKLADAFKPKRTLNTGEILRIRVQGYQVPQGPQPYALVITGPFSELTECEFNMDPNAFEEAVEGDHRPEHSYWLLYSVIAVSVAVVLLIICLIIWCVLRKMWADDDD